MPKILDTLGWEAAPTLAGEPALLADPRHHFQPHLFFPHLAGSDGLPSRAIFTGSHPKSPLPLWLCTTSPCNPRQLVFKSIKLNFYVVLFLHGFQALGQDHAKGGDPSRKPSPLFPKPRRRPLHQHLSRFSPSINPLCLGTRGH